MNLYIDKQTTEDLNIFGKRNSIFELFQHTHTLGGRSLLEQWFQYPLAEAEKINARVALFQTFQQVPLVFPFQPAWFDAATGYLSQRDSRTLLQQDDRKLERTFQHLIGADGAYQDLIKGIGAILHILHAFQDFLRNTGLEQTPYQQERKEISNLLNTAALSEALQQHPDGKLAHEQAVHFDQLFRFKEHESLQKILHKAFELDVYISIAQLAKEKNYHFPLALEGAEERLEVKDLCHPLVPKATGNSLNLSPEQSVVFLTGANMAGKSTFMKSLGIALFLAHVGFPVAASQMRFSVREAIYTSINLPDNLQQGYSHFYAEVLRVKQVVQQLAEGKRLFVIFDELFRGTNVKDAYDATEAITAAIAKKGHCQFIISTHIIEVGELLQNNHSNIQFVYLPTEMRGQTPVYTYRLKQGITADRHGMVIIQNEGILDILNIKKTKQS